MLQDIFPHVYHVEWQKTLPLPGDYVYAFEKRGNNAVSLAKSGEKSTLLRFEDFPEGGAEFLYLFSIDDKRFFLADNINAEARALFAAPEGFSPPEHTWSMFASLTAQQLFLWYDSHRICGCCGVKNAHSDIERAVICPQCGLTVYPKISPVVIIGVTNGDKLLVTRYKNRPINHYALVAGFVETGETLEDCVRREVLEETGVRVKNLRYYKSQPWPMSSSLLSGFFCDLDGDDTLNADGVELSEAIWLDRADVPAMPEPNIALTAEMMDTFRNGKEPK